MIFVDSSNQSWMRWQSATTPPHFFTLDSE
jgi:hypothetical protein